MLTQESLDQFSGTIDYYLHWDGKLAYTDGIRHLIEEGNAGWLIDTIAAYQNTHLIAEDEMLQDMQFWKLRVKDNRAVLTCVADSGKQPAIIQIIEYTDFPLEKVEVWVERSGFMTGNNFCEKMIAMLPGER